MFAISAVIFSSGLSALIFIIYGDLIYERKQITI